MKTYLHNLISEKTGISFDTLLTVEGNMGANIIPLSILVDAILAAPATEQAAIRTVLVKIDFVNGSVLDYFTHLAQAIAI